MPGRSQGEGLTGPGAPDDHGDAGAALADIAEHRLLVLAGGGMGGQGRPNGLVGDHGGLLAGAADGRGDQLLLHGEELGGRPAALLQRPLGDHGHRPLGQEPVGQVLELGPGGTGQLAAEGGDHVRAGEGGRLGGQPVRTGQPIEHLSHRRLGHRPVLGAVGCPAGHLPDQDVRVHPPLGCLCPPAAVQGVRALMLLGFAGGLDGPLDQPRCPLPTVRRQFLDGLVDLVGALGEAPHQLLGHPLELAVAVDVRRRPLHPERPGKLTLVAGPIDGVGGQPMPVQIAAVHRPSGPWTRLATTRWVCSSGSPSLDVR
jgi:hypothetical protein